MRRACLVVVPRSRTGDDPPPLFGGYTGALRARPDVRIGQGAYRAARSLYRAIDAVLWGHAGDRACWVLALGAAIAAALDIAAHAIRSATG